MSRLLSLTLNGRARTDAVTDNLLLLDYLREVVGLTGTKTGCDRAPDQRSNKEELKSRHHPRELTTRYRHGAEARQRGHHPNRGPQDRVVLGHSRSP